MVAWRQAVERIRLSWTNSRPLRAARMQTLPRFQERLESEVVAARKARARLHELMEKYRAAYAEDDVMRARSGRMRGIRSIGNRARVA